jgi:hypothetical protein
MTPIIKLDAKAHPIKSVTVFKSNKAEIVRIFNVSLEVGRDMYISKSLQHLMGCF